MATLADTAITTDAVRPAPESRKPDLPEGVPPLSMLYLYLSGACNLACLHCWITPAFQPDGDGGPHLELDHLRKVLDEGAPLGLRTVKLTGGEPTLHPRFREVVKLIADHGMRILMETNGTLIDEDLAAFIRQAGVFGHVSVSVDGARAETHEALRRVPGSYAKALRGIELLVGVGLRPQLICTLYQGNVGEMGDVIALAESLGCESVKFNIVQSIGRGERLAEREGFKLQDVLALYGRIEKEFSRQTKLPLHFDVPIAFHPVRMLLTERVGFCGIRSVLGVLATGELALCGIGVTIPELVYGHIATHDLRDVWCNSPGLVQMRALVPSQLEGVCGECIHRNECQGHCVADNYHRSGRLSAAHLFCEEANALGLFPASRKRG